MRADSLSCVTLAIALCLPAISARTDTLDSVIERLDRLEQENRRLRDEIDALKSERRAQAGSVPTVGAAASESPAAGFVRADPAYGYEVVDPTTSINRKQRLILERRRDGTLAPDTLHVQGAVTAIVNHQSSNRDDKFGFRRIVPGQRDAAPGSPCRGTGCPARSGPERQRSQGVRVAQHPDSVAVELLEGEV